VSGGLDDKGAPTKTTFVLTPNLSTGQLGQWQTGKDLQQSLDLPEARTGGTLVALADGLLFAGGEGPNGVSATTWKSKVNNGVLGAWQQQADLAAPLADTTSALVGNYVWLIGGRDSKGPTAAVERGTVAQSGDQQGQVTQWATNSGQNLPAPRTNSAGILSTGTIYIVGGNDGSGSRGEVYWTAPISGPNGDQLDVWRHLAVDDLPAPGVEGGSATVSGSTLFVTGGRHGSQVAADTVRADLAPQQPFFQLGLVGATVPALKINGELGQQLGYLNAAGAGTVNFIILLIIGWAFAHRERTRAFFERMRARRRR
jgi:hypothetical protein